MATQLKDKNGTNVYPVVEGGSGGGSDINYSSEYEYSYDLLTEQGYINSSGGVTDESRWLHSDYLPIVGDSIRVKYSCPDWGNYNYAYYAFYNENKTFISGKAFLCKDAKTEVTHDFSSWASKPAYVRFSGVPCYVINESEANYDFRNRFWFKAHQPLEGEDAIRHDIANAGSKMYRILLFGNSFTENTLNYMEGICRQMNITNIQIQYVGIASALLADYAARLESENDVCESTQLKPAVDMFDAYPLGSMVEVMSHDWDMIFFQQQSSNSGKYETYEPYLTSLINAAKMYCTNPNVRIGWMFTWGTMQNGVLTSYASISAAVKKMSIQHPDVIIVPVGTALENARGTSLNADGGMLCSDYDDSGSSAFYQHCWGGAGSYILACTFFEKIIAPVTGKSIFCNAYSIASNGHVGHVAVNDSNRFICHACAKAAIENPFEVTDPELLDPNYVAS